MKPKKSLGQNFLKDHAVIKKIISVSDLTPDDLVIEIGPGEGVMTSEISKFTRKIITVEKDRILADNFAKNFQFPIFNFQSISNDQVYQFPNRCGIISGDILKINLPKLIEANKFFNYKVIANIPYYITSPIIQLFLETKYPPTEMILMVQKEVAQRITAKPGGMSILAASVQYYAKAEKLFDVPKTAFWPVPEVDSAVIRITRNARLAEDSESRRVERGTKEEAKEFFRVVRAGFSSRRKKLVNNLAGSFQMEKMEAEEIIKKIGLDPKVRAQELGVEDWKKLAKSFDVKE